MLFAAFLQEEGLHEFHRLFFDENGLLDLIRQGSEQSVGATREAKVLTYLAYGTCTSFVATQQSAALVHKFAGEHWGKNAFRLKEAVRGYEYFRHSGACKCRFLPGYRPSNYRMNH